MASLMLAPAAGTDLNIDGIDGLVIGAPDGGSDFDDRSSEVIVLYGSGTGPTGQGLVLTQDGPIPEVRERGNFFGGSLTVGDLFGDTTVDLVMGAHRHDVGLVDRARTVTIVPNG